MAEETRSLAEIVAALPKDEQEAVLAELDEHALLYDWSFWGRPKQHIKPGGWNVTLVNAGRGFGKTRLAAEWVRERAKDTSHGPLRIALVGRTAADTRDVMLDGDSGILNVCPPSERPDYQPSKRRLVWPNGTTATLFTADEPSNLRGPQFHIAWGDEIAAWRRLPDDSGLTAWDNLRIATRLGQNPQILATTTPKRTQLMFDLIKESNDPDRKGSVVVVNGSTRENAGNLNEAYLNQMYGIYAGTSIAQQELDGIMIDSVGGALWSHEVIENNRDTLLGRRVDFRPPLIAIGVDPSVAENPKDECGIVVVGSTAERNLYQRRAWVLEDASIWGAPTVWAQKVVEMARKWDAPVIAEVNQGGALVRNTIQNIDPNVRVLEVHSKVGKRLRAEPITLAYQQERVVHIDEFGDLESQMTTWLPEESKYSPDRVDALVHGLTALLITPPRGLAGGTLQSKSVAQRRINVGSTATRNPGRGSNRGGSGGGGRGLRLR